ncbi:MAG: hybrid sensor histidine kinase/response regulator [Sideroxydans sp.]
MPDQMITQNERRAIEAELVRAYFKDADILNLAGFLVFLLLSYVVHDAVPWWTWTPGLFFLGLVTLFRAYHLRQYRRAPEGRNSGQWINGQTAVGGLAGLCWGMSSAAMIANLPTTLQLFVLTVCTVVAAAATFESFFLVQPPRIFILTSISPLALWLLTVGGGLHTALGIMLLAFMAVAIALGNKKSRIFTEAQHLRFQNEFLAKELSRQHGLIEGASRSKSRFLAAASHDLRQPLAALMIFLELLESERQLSAKGKDNLEKAQQATSSLRTLLDALLDISKLDARAIKPDLRPISVQNLFNVLEKEFLPLAERKNIRLRFAACSALVKSDPTLLGQILRNLISNAVRYTRSGGILVGCRHRNGMLEIEVHDTGIGIAEDQLAKVFDEFYQVENQERDREQGLGLGLSIVDRATRLLGHTVTVRSRPGKGSSFGVAVPLIQTGEIEEQPASTHTHNAGELAGRLIAVIENEGSIRVGMQNLLQTWGCKVVVADSAAAMVEQLGTLGEVDMVISDFGLRGPQNGIDAIAALRQSRGADLPALLFTGDISKETYMAARNAGMLILYKPANPETLREAITAAFCKACQ